MHEAGRSAAVGRAQIAVVIGAALALGCSNGLPDYYGDMPDFPWNPPRATAKTVFSVATPQATLGSEAQRLAASLGALGYDQLSFYGVPGGFAVVTRVERIEPDGRNASVDRWSTALASQSSPCIRCILSALFKARSGHYRQFVFVLTDAPVVDDGEPLGLTGALELEHGAGGLPVTLAARPIETGHRWTVLVYVYEKKNISGKARLLESFLSAGEHLKATGVDIGGQT